jgi:predicted nuclease with TOPRIM domain
MLETFIRISAAKSQKRWRAKPDVEIEAVRAATTKAALALAQAENDLLSQRILDLEAAVASRENALRSAHTKADCEVAFLNEQNKELQAQSDVLRQRVLELETTVASGENALRSAHTRADCDVAFLKEQNKELQSQLHQTWNWYDNEITRVGGLTFKTSSLIAKALHPDAVPNEEVRLQAFKAFSAWKSDRDAARRR